MLSVGVCVSVNEIRLLAAIRRRLDGSLGLGSMSGGDEGYYSRLGSTCSVHGVE